MLHNIVYITVPSEKEGINIAKILVKEKLVACVNIINNVSSIFYWNADIKIEKEVIIIAKTKNNLVEKLKKRVETVHSYECPCILVLPIISGNKSFLNWVDDELKND